VHHHRKAIKFVSCIPLRDSRASEPQGAVKRERIVHTCSTDFPYCVIIASIGTSDSKGADIEISFIPKKKMNSVAFAVHFGKNDGIELL